MALSVGQTTRFTGGDVDDPETGALGVDLVDDGVVFLLFFALLFGLTVLVPAENGKASTVGRPAEVAELPLEVPEALCLSPVDRRQVEVGRLLVFAVGDERECLAIR